MDGGYKDYKGDCTFLPLTREAKAVTWLKELEVPEREKEEASGSLIFIGRSSFFGSPPVKLSGGRKNDLCGRVR